MIHVKGSPFNESMFPGSLDTPLKRLDERLQKEMEKNKDPLGYEKLDRYRAYKWVKYVLKVQHIYVNGFEKIKWYYVTAISANNAIDLFRAQYGNQLNWEEGEYMLILGVYDKPNSMYIGDYQGNKLPPLK